MKLRRSGPARAVARLLPVLALAALLGGCGTPLPVTYDRDHCSLGGQPATVEQVESEQLRIARRVISRQPIQTGVTVFMLLLAGAGYLDKVVLLLAARRAPLPSFAERARAVLDRHRAHPTRYFAIVSTGLGLVLLLAGAYIYLDADKRISDRALQQLQFCHLALKTAEAQGALEQQRQNLTQLAGTTASIKALVDQLPPDEQRKAQTLLASLKVALGNQSVMLERQSEVEAKVATGAAQIEHDLGALQADVGGLRPVPQRLSDMNEALSRLVERTQLDGEGKGPQTLGAALLDVRRRVDAVSEKVAAVDCARARLPSGKTLGEALEELSARPAPSCPPPPACRCEWSDKGAAPVENRAAARLAGRDGGAS